MNYVDIFSNLGFDFKNDLKSKSIEIEKNSVLSDKLNNSVFFYKSPNNTNTSFYLITTFLENIEIEEIRKYIWNKNDADLIFYYPNEDAKLIMFYAKYSPKINFEESILDRFSTSEKDLDKIEKIRHWRFDSGVFWLNYHKFIEKAKYKGIDKELVATLKALKEQLFTTLSKLISEDIKCNSVVQALIDRTLYIKYLEDNHIINSHFYKHYFEDATLNYEKILDNNSDADLNKLFKKIHEIFNNNLFDQPTIENDFLTNEVRSLISSSFKANLNTGQLRLYDFQFDVLPVEFISYIYEVFLSEKQKENGIYYTPKKLAQLIIDEVINKDEIGAILDPSSGSGMFLIVGYQRLLEIAKKQGLEPKDSIGKIKFRTQLLSNNIFGIEKELTAQRFTFFSLSLQIFEGINPSDIKEFIANELNEKDRVDLFSEFSFFDNIKHANTLNLFEKPFENKKFLYLVGNPPFFEIPNTVEFENEISFLNSYKVDIANKDNVLRAKQIVGKSQISQCFFLKIKDWSNENTRFGFVSNSSNFYNDYSNDFQDYFYSNYGIEKIYELSRVKKILFEKANESVVAIIFNNNLEKSITEYYPVDLGLFSEKPFELLIIQEDKIIEIEQKELITKKTKLRDFLIGNEFDRIFINRLNNFSQLESLLDINKDSLQGLTRKSNIDITDFLNINISDFKKFDQKNKKKIQKEYELKKYLSETQDNIFTTPYIYEYVNISQFKITRYDGYINPNLITKEYFQRPRGNEIFKGNKILITRVGNTIKAVYTPFDVVFSVNIFGIKTIEDKYNYFTTALLNSYLVNYIINIRDKKRIGDNLPRIDGNILRNIPIPNNFDQNLVNQISNISKELTENLCEYSEKEDELNELIYELYELSYWEKRRVKDYFLNTERIGKKRNKLDNYKNVIKEVLSFYLKNSIQIIETPAEFNLIVVKISLNNHSDTPKAGKTKKFILNEIFENNANGNFLASQEKIFGQDCVYIIKEDKNTNWSETKAFEDGQDILKHIIPNENGERVH